MYNNPFDKEDLVMTRELWEKSMETVEQFISSLNFWRENGREKVAAVGLFGEIRGLEEVEAFDEENRLDKWIKIIFKS